MRRTAALTLLIITLPGCSAPEHRPEASAPEPVVIMRPPAIAGLVREATDDLVEREMKGPGVHVAMLTADWCIPCRTLKVRLDLIAPDYIDDVSFYTIDIDRCPRTAAALNSRALPTLLIYRDGEEIDRVIGVREEPQLREMIEALVGS